MQAKIAVHSLRHEYVDSYTGEYVRALDDLSLEVAPGEFLTVVGPITSGLALIGSLRGAHYAASKAAINAFTRSLAKETADDGINVNAVAPGLTDTPMMRGANSPEYIATMANTMPGGRLGQLQDVVGLVLFLVSEAARDITGQVIFFRG